MSDLRKTCARVQARFRSSAWLKDGLALLALFALWATFFWRFFAFDPLDRVTFASGDFTDQFYAFRTYAFRELRAGHIPLWISCTYGGAPFLADSQAALAYPPVILSLLAALGAGLPKFPLRWLELEALLHILGIAFCTYALLRGEVRSRLAALLGATVYTFGGYLTSYPPLQLAILESGFWLPLSLWAARRLARTGQRGYLVALVAALAFNFLVGHPQTFLFCFYATLAFYAWHAWQARRRWTSALGQIALAVALVVGLVAVQLWPTIEYLSLCTRSSTPYALSATGFPPQDIAQLAVTGLVSFWQPLYVGLLPLALGWLGVWAAWRRRERRGAFFWLGLTAVSLILSCGGNLFGYDLAYLLLPGMRLFRGQERLAILVSLGLSALAAHGADVLISALRRCERDRLRRMAWLLSALALTAFGLVVQVEILRHLAGAGDAAARVSGRLSIAALALLGSGGVLAARYYLPRRRLPVGGLAMAVIVFDLFSVNRGMNTVPLRQPYADLPGVDIVLADKDLYRIQDDLRLPGHAACYLNRQEVSSISPFKPARYARFLDRAPEAVRWKLMGVRYLFSWRGDLVTREGIHVEGERLYQKGETASPNATLVYRLADGGQRAFLVHQVHLARDDDELYALMGEAGFDPAQAVVLFQDVPTRPANGPESVNIVHYASSRVELQATLSAAGVLVLGDLFYPGWHAYVDGRRAHLYEADGAFRAVLLEAGEHTIVFRFEPLSVYVGAGLSALTSLILLGMLAARRGRSTT